MVKILMSPYGTLGKLSSTLLGGDQNKQPVCDLIDRIDRGELLLKQQTKCDGRGQKSFT